MTALINEMKFAAPDEPLELTAHIGRGHNVVIAPDEQGGFVDLFELIRQIVADGALRQSQDLDDLQPFIDNAVFGL